MEEIFSKALEAAMAMSIWEVIAVICGLLSVWFSKKNNVLVYPTGIISVIIYVWICLEYKLYADMGINVYYFVMSVYGWYIWTKKDENRMEVPITANSYKENIQSLLLTGSAFILLAFVLKKYTDSDVPLWDAATTSVAVTGMWLMAKRKLENWVAWIITDIISVPLYFYKGLPLTSFQFLIFTGLAIAGYYAWKKEITKREAKQVEYAA